MPGPDRARRRAGWVILWALIVAMSFVGWGLSRHHARPAAPRTPADEAGDDDGAILDAAAAFAAGAGPGTGPHMAELPDLLRRSRGNPGPLIAAFVAWAGEPAALAARRVVLGALAAEPRPMVRVAALLTAIQASPLAPGDDPLRPDVVAAVSAAWTRETMRKGRDLLFAEPRPKAREVVISSFVAFALSDRSAGLDQAQRYALTSDFIDLYRQASSSQRRDIVAVVRRLGGDDTAELLQGNGFGVDSQLPTHVQYRRALEAAQKSATGGSSP